MEQTEIKDLLNKMNALEGESINSLALMQDPIVTNRLAVELLQKIDRDAKPELVIAPQGDGSYFGYSVALTAWMRFVYAEPTGDAFVLPEGIEVKQKEKTLVVVDSYDETVVSGLLALAEDKGVKVQAVLCLVGSAQANLSVPCISLL